MEENLHTVKIIDLVIPVNINGIFIVMTYFPNDLNKILALDKDNTGFTQQHTTMVIFRILCAIRFLHKANVMFRDLRPENMLIDENCNLMLWNFENARTSPKVETKKKYYSRQ